ncbi:MAG: hypothetical protein ACK4YR_03220, partial [Bacteroidota bacterium]
MSPIFSRIVLLLWLGFSSQIVFAQSPTDSIVHFQSGDFLPVRNYKDVAANSSILASALHQSKYYVVIQFERIPDQDVRAVLKSQGVELVDYIPSNAYTATIPATVNW